MTLSFKRLARPVASRRPTHLHCGHAAEMALHLGGDPTGDASPACPVSPVVSALTRATEYASIEDLLAGELDRSVHVECFRETTERAMRAVGRLYAGRRQAYYLGTDRGFDRDTVRSYLRFFSRLAGGAAAVDATLERFGLAQLARTTVRRLTPEQAALLNFARMSLFEPEVCFCEHPLHDLLREGRPIPFAA